MFVTNWISTTKIQKISEITNFFRHYFLSRTEVEYWFPSEGALKADETTPCFRNIDIKNVTVNDKTYKKIDEKGITLDF